MLENSGTPHCGRCRYRDSYDAETSGEFGGVELCDDCRHEWQVHLGDFPGLAAKVLLPLCEPAFCEGTDEMTTVGEMPACGEFRDARCNGLTENMSWRARTEGERSGSARRMSGFFLEVPTGGPLPGEDDPARLGRCPEPGRPEFDALFAASGWHRSKTYPVGGGCFGMELVTL
ncbi:hypothetical protein [Streptomyces sp. NPDC048277]|uniref:hypothetical protein n=1 Tax=Streptomyces sp. NPDC048277 TaxID=3155027 RepID=UPI0033F59435